jgi:Uma2 family endonuclease
MSTTEFTFQSDVAPPVPIHRFTVEQYHALGEQGLLGPEDRVELLEGLIVQKMNQLPPHGFAVRYLDHWLQSIVADGWLIQCQLPITLSTSEPEPDLAVLRGSLGDFMKRHPSGEDCRLVIEVADSSLSRDLGKAAIYASAGVEEYWIVKIANKSLLRMRQPSEGIYQETSELLRDESIDFLLGDHSVSFPLNNLFPE